MRLIKSYIKIENSDCDTLIFKIFNDKLIDYEIDSKFIIMLLKKNNKKRVLNAFLENLGEIENVLYYKKLIFEIVIKLSSESKTISFYEKKQFFQYVFDIYNLTDKTNIGEVNECLDIIDKLYLNNPDYAQQVKQIFSNI